MTACIDAMAAAPSGSRRSQLDGLEIELSFKGSKITMEVRWIFAYGPQSIIKLLKSISHELSGSWMVVKLSAALRLVSAAKITLRLTRTVA